MYEILKAGGFTTGGLNFDAKVRRQSTDKYDLFYGHIGAMDTMALSLKIAARMVEDGELDKRVAKRYLKLEWRAGAADSERTTLFRRTGAVCGAAQSGASTSKRSSGAVRKSG